MAVPTPMLLAGMSPSEAFAALAFFGLIGVGLSPLVKAISSRIAGGAGGGAEVRSLREEVEQLHAEVADLRAGGGELDDIHNRLDFAERMLAQVRDKNALP